jgi:hypothetical protein
MNSFNDEVCEFNYFSVTENFDSDNKKKKYPHDIKDLYNFLNLNELSLPNKQNIEEPLCDCLTYHSPVICNGKEYHNIDCAVSCGKEERKNCKDDNKYIFM